MDLRTGRAVVEELHPRTGGYLYYPGRWRGPTTYRRLPHRGVWLVPPRRAFGERGRLLVVDGFFAHSYPHYHTAQRDSGRWRAGLQFVGVHHLPYPILVWFEYWFLDGLRRACDAVRYAGPVDFTGVRVV